MEGTGSAGRGAQRCRRAACGPGAGGSRRRGRAARGRSLHRRRPARGARGRARLAPCSRPLPGAGASRPRAERSGPAPGRPQPMGTRRGGRSGPSRHGPAPPRAAASGTGTRGSIRAPPANGPSALLGCRGRQGSDRQPQGTRREAALPDPPVCNGLCTRRYGQERVV